MFFIIGMIEKHIILVISLRRFNSISSSLCLRKVISFSNVIFSLSLASISALINRSTIGSPKTFNQNGLTLVINAYIVRFIFESLIRKGCFSTQFTSPFSYFLNLVKSENNSSALPFNTSSILP